VSAVVASDTAALQNWRACCDPLLFVGRFYETPI